MPRDRQPLPKGFGSLWLTVVLDLVGFGIVLPILPLYTRDLGASALTVGVVLAAYSAAQMIGSPILGRLSDRYGRRPVLVIALAGSSIGHLVTGLAGSIPLIILARALDGFSGGSLAVAHAAAADLAPPPQRPRLFGLLGAGIALGFVAGPAMGSLAAFGGPKLPFFLAAGLCGFNAMTAWWRLPAFRPTTAPSAPAASAGSGSPTIAETATAPAPARKLALLHPSSTLGRVLLTGLIMGIGFAGFESTFSLLGKERVGLTEGSTGLVFAGIGLVLSVVQAVVVKRAIGRFGPKHTAQTAMALNVVGFVLLIPAAGWWALLPALFVLTVGQGLFSPAMSTVVSSVAGPEQRGALFGVQQSVSALGRILGPLVALGLFGLNISLPYVLAATLGVGGLISLARLRIPGPTDAPPLLPKCPEPAEQTPASNSSHDSHRSNGSRPGGSDTAPSPLASGATPPAT